MAASSRLVDDPSAFTEIQQHGKYWLKRDDLFEIGGARGGKARACWGLIQQGIAQGSEGLITAGSPDSPQMQIVARLANEAGLPARCHCSTKASVIKDDAKSHGAELVEHKCGYLSNINAKSVEDAAANPDWTFIPFGMKGTSAVEYTRKQVDEIPEGVKRIVIAVGSGMSAAGVLLGLRDAGLTTPVLGVVVGADPTKTLNDIVPGWGKQMTLVQSQYAYDEAVDATIDGVRLDPIYEAKCNEFLLLGDLFWIIGIRSDDAVEALLANKTKPRANRNAPPRTPARRQATEGGEAGTKQPGAKTVLLTPRQLKNIELIKCFLRDMPEEETQRYEQLIDSAKECADRYDARQRQAIYAAKECGDVLHEIKKLLPYGTWCEWLLMNEDRLGVKQRMANVYMAISREWKDIEPVLAEKGRLSIEQTRAILKKRPEPNENGVLAVFQSPADLMRQAMCEEVTEWAKYAPDEQIEALRGIWGDMFKLITDLSAVRMGITKLVGHYQSGEYRIRNGSRYKLHWRIVETPDANPANDGPDNWDDCDNPGEFVHFEPVPAAPKPEPGAETADEEQQADEWNNWDAGEEATTTEALQTV